MLDRIDGLILAGGSDVDPATYGAEPHPETKGTWPERDRFELALARRALERDMPLLGICRGMQMLNVALGGTLDQHLPDQVGHEDHRDTPGELRRPRGAARARLARGACRRRRAITVKSHHHQGVDRVAEGLTVSGWSLDDELVEAIELPGQGFVLGVLWHPEEDVKSRVIGALVEAARLARNPALPDAKPRKRRAVIPAHEQTSRQRREFPSELEPATEQVMAEVPRAGAEEVDAAVAAAKAAFPGWRAMAPGDRAALLHRLADAARRARRGPGPARGAKRRQADRRRPRRDGDGRADLPLLRRAGSSGCSGRRSRSPVEWT